MKNHFLAILVLAAPCLARTVDQSVAPAGQLPCPVNLVVNETREHNAKQGRTLPESFYQGLSTNYVRQCQQANMTITDLAPKLQEYEAGKRSERDGYIILQLLSNQYENLRAENTPAARDIKDKLNTLIKKHPDYPRIQDPRLSEELQKETTRANQLKEARSHKPRDPSPVAVFGSDHDLVARYQYRLEFFSLSTDMRIELGRTTKIFRQTPDGPDKLVELSKLKPTLVLRFNHSIDVLPRSMSRSPKSNLLVCTSPLARYSPIGNDEIAMANARGYRYGMPWTDTNAAIKDFCGIVTQSGQTIFKFPVVQKIPGTLIVPIGVADNGKRAVIGIGERIVAGDEEGSREEVGKLRELQVWQFPNKLKRIKKLPHYENLNDLYELFLQDKL